MEKADAGALANGDGWRPEEAAPHVLLGPLGVVSLSPFLEPFLAAQIKPASLTCREEGLGHAEVGRGRDRLRAEPVHNDFPVPEGDAILGGRGETDVYDSILKKIRGCVRNRQYVMTLHADDEMDDDSLSIFDVECAILTGEIVERQKDRDTDEAKYLVHGHALSGEDVFVVAKLGPSKKMVIITVYLA